MPKPTITSDEALVRMVSMSINPGDFLFVQNLYPEPKKPHFPGQHALHDFRAAIHETIHRPERGKRFLKLSSQND